MPRALAEVQVAWAADRLGRCAPAVAWAESGVNRLGHWLSGACPESAPLKIKAFAQPQVALGLKAQLQELWVQ